MKKLIPLLAIIGALALAGCNQSPSNENSGTSIPSGNGTMTATNGATSTNSAPAQ